MSNNDPNVCVKYLCLWIFSLKYFTNILKLKQSIAFDYFDDSSMRNDMIKYYTNVNIIFHFRTKLKPKNKNKLERGHYAQHTLLIYIIIYICIF